MDKYGGMTEDDIKPGNTFTMGGKTIPAPPPKSAPSTYEPLPNKDDAATNLRRQRIRSGQAPMSPAAKAVKSVLGHWTEEGKSKEKRQAEMTRLQTPAEYLASQDTNDVNTQE